MRAAVPFPSPPAGWMTGEAFQEGPPQGSGPWECGSVRRTWGPRGMSSLLSAEEARPVSPSHPAAPTSLTHHSHKTPGSLVDAGIPPRNRVFYQVISPGLRLRAEGRGFSDPKPPSQVLLCSAIWSLALMPPAFGFCLLPLKHCHTYFLITCPCKLHVVFTLFTSKEPEAWSCRMCLCPPAGSRCSPWQARYRAFWEKGCPLSCWVLVLLLSWSQPRPCSLSWVFSLHAYILPGSWPQGTVYSCVGCALCNARGRYRLWVAPPGIVRHYVLPTQHHYLPLASCWAIRGSWACELPRKSRQWNFRVLFRKWLASSARGKEGG